MVGARWPGICGWIGRRNDYSRNALLCPHLSCQPLVGEQLEADPVAQLDHQLGLLVSVKREA